MYSQVGGHYHNDLPWKVNILGLNVLEKTVQYKRQSMLHSQDVLIGERPMENCSPTEETITTKLGI